MVTQPTDGGVFDHVARLSAALAQRGHMLAICGPLDQRSADPELETIPLAMVRAVSPIRDLRNVAGFASVVRRFRPDLVHAHSSKAGAIARLARVAAPRTPVIYTPHGYAFAGYFESEWRRRAYRLAERALAPLASRVLCVCDCEGRLATSIGPASKVRVVHNGVTPPVPPAESASERVHPALSRLAQRGPVIGTVTLLRPGKGVETLIDAFPAVLRSHPTAQLVIAGGGPERPRLEARAMNTGAGEALLFLGATSEPASVLRGLDVFVNPSWAESFPYTVLEAMSREVPIVATDVGGTGEAIEDGVTGLLVPRREPLALADAIARLLEDRQLARSLASEARRRVTQRFSFDAMLEDTLDVYRELGI